MDPNQIYEKMNQLESEIAALKKMSGKANEEVGRTPLQKSSNILRGKTFYLTLFALFFSTVLVLYAIPNTFSAGDVVSSSQINENFSALKNTLENNFSTLNTSIGNVHAVPVGSIVAWHKSLGGVPTIPTGWIECDGSIINDSESSLNGQLTPNLNGQRRFLRGDATSGAEETDAFQGHRHNLTESGTQKSVVLLLPYDPGNGNEALDTGSLPRRNIGVGDPITDGPNGTPRTATETRPVNMAVVWIIKIK